MRAGLLGDGPTDRALLPVLKWLVGHHCETLVEIHWIDSDRFSSRPHGLVEKVAFARQSGPFDLLFIHRDAEREAPARWYEEIRRAAGDDVHVCVVPVRMTEAWLLVDEDAIREAAGRPNGKNRLPLPPLSRIESLPDPKAVLRRALLSAGGATGRRARRFDSANAFYRLADLVEDWSPLRSLTAFCRLEEDVRSCFKKLENR